MGRLSSEKNGKPPSKHPGQYTRDLDGRAGLIALAALTFAPGQDVQAAIKRGLAWLCERLAAGKHDEPTPIGLYFARLWYSEAMYPLTFSLGALERISRAHGKS